MMYTFDEYTLDMQRYELRRSRQRLTLEPLVFNVLAYLVQHHDRVIPKHELLDRLWGHTVVDDGSVRRCIRVARQVLSDAPQAPRFIETLYRRGYRFIAPVEPLAEPSTAGTPQRETDVLSGTRRQHCPACHQACGWQAMFCSACGQRLQKNPFLQGNIST